MSANPYPQAFRFSAAIYIALVSLAWLVNYPGRVMPDTLDMIVQGQYPETLNDWHAPVITSLYSLFTPIFGQPSAALFLQASLLFVYPAIVPVSPDNRRLGIVTAALEIASGLFVAALAAIAGQILKDVVHIGAVLCLLAVLDLSNASSSPNSGKWLALKLVFLFRYCPRGSAKAAEADRHGMRVMKQSSDPLARMHTMTKKQGKSGTTAPQC